MLIGLDVGGTHIDAVIIDNRKIIKIVKKPVDQADLETSIWQTIEELIIDVEVSKIKQINLSTTISTNAIVENKTSKVGMIIQNGPGLTNELLRLTNDDVFISGYTDHRGIIVKQFNPEEIAEAIKHFKAKNLDSIGVATKFSPRNPLSEQILEKHLKKDFSVVSLSHQLSGRLNFPRRIKTTFLNASIQQIFQNFANNITASLNKKNISAPIYILKADGGIISLAEAQKRPVETILSGPAASLMGFQGLMNIEGDAILLDIGGTTTDIFILADGVFLFEPLGIEIANHKTLIRAIFSKSIGLGGDSAIEIVNNKLTIGPKRDGKAFSLGGPTPTLTDAFIYLEKLKIGEKKKAELAMQLLGNQLSLSPLATAKLIIDYFSLTLKEEIIKVLATVNNKPVYTIKELLHGKTIVPQSINIIGGPAKLLAPAIEKHFNLKCNFPEQYATANAIGAALSKTTGEINLHIDTSKQTLTVPELGLIKKINKDLTLADARKLAFEYLTISAAKNEKISADELEIVAESSFNMIDGFYLKGKNIRIKAQVKPGLIYRLGGETNEKN